ncbi:MAG: DNA polymerase IV, partial [Spiroplasma sp.]|nr:DNA polymerase IV [Mycoplasmatales bacterium]
MGDLVQQSKIIHIDMDYFYAQVEVRDNPKLLGKPIVISGSPNSRSVVCTCSYEAREFGIHAGISAYEASKLCPVAIFVAPNFEKYNIASAQMHIIFNNYTDIVEPLSLDEAYLDVTVNKKGIRSATQVANMIRAEIYQKTKLTCSAGVSYNKFIAKVASDVNKPNGTKVVAPKDAEQFLDNLEIKKFYGVGKKSINRFYDLGIYNGKDLKKLSYEKCEKYFGKLGISLYYNVRGIDERQVIVEREIKSIGFERTLRDDISEKEVLYSLFNKVVEFNIIRLKKQRKAPKTVSIKIRFSDFSQLTRSKTLPNYLKEYNVIFSVVKELLQNITLEGKKIRLVGTSCSNLIDYEKVKNIIRFEQILLNLEY